MSQSPSQSPSPSPTPTQSDDTQDVETGRLLDGFLLLAAGGSSTPEDVVSVNLASLQVIDVADEDLTFFAHLDRLDVSDNRLSHENVLQQFGRLPRLASLSLACNSISALEVPAGILRHLQSLDLSYNGLHGEVMTQLARLPSLVTLNLSSNCISLVPPEGEICGLRSLEELILDNNDLVQFVQWRALDALPRLRKLSLASNRIKRLKDDIPDTNGGDISYFAALEELDLSSNEIATVDKLPVVHFCRRLQILRLSNNPCMKGPGAQAQNIPGIKVHAEQSKQWYLCGSGCFQRKPKPTQPKLKFEHKKMRKVRSTPHVGPARNRGMPQLCVYDEEANQLLVALQGVPGLATGTAKTPMDEPVTAIAPLPLPQDDGTMMHDDLSEDELDQIFRERRANIEKSFNAPVEEPARFIRSTPFAESASEKANQKLRRINGAEEEPPAAAPATPTAGGGLGRQSSSLLFSLTSLGDDAADLIRGAQARQKPSTSSQPRGRQVESPAPATPGAVRLPPIDASSRSSSVCGGSAADPLGGHGGYGGRPAPPMPDIGVREAMRALRAAALSEYAVAS